MSVIGVDPEPALGRRKPAIDYGADGDSALPEPKRERLLLRTKTGIALHAKRHGQATPCLRHNRPGTLALSHRVLDNDGKYHRC